jgi:uncharacterized protein (TIGR00255 family)
LRLPAELGAAEQGIRRRILARIRRGRVELNLKVERVDGQPAAQFNRTLFEELLATAKALKDEYGLEGTLDLSTAISLPGLFRGDSAALEWSEAQQGALEGAIEGALDALEGDRSREGANLRRELLDRLQGMIDVTARVRARAEQLPDELKRRLLERIEALSGEASLEPGRIEQEAVLLAERADVTEEIVRLEGHLEQAHRLVSKPDGEPVGKRLEFLLQEIHRETNTINSKSADLALSREALVLKTESEKVREQVHNLE